jgi:hypothetical protein
VQMSIEYVTLGANIKVKKNAVDADKLLWLGPGSSRRPIDFQSFARTN